MLWEGKAGTLGTGTPGRSQGGGGRLKVVFAAVI